MPKTTSNYIRIKSMLLDRQFSCMIDFTEDDLAKKFKDYMMEKLIPRLGELKPDDEFLLFLQGEPLKLEEDRTLQQVLQDKKLNDRLSNIFIYRKSDQKPSATVQTPPPAGVSLNRTSVGATPVPSPQSSLNEALQYYSFYKREKNALDEKQRQNRVYGERVKDALERINSEGQLTNEQKAKLTHKLNRLNEELETTNESAAPSPFSTPTPF